ncbi:MAG: sugar porter family MFS transporter [Porphyromonadaceae bacterium]|nr:sugar porter family MFS transporter [Porphyromonadaceae bacterium]
MKNTENSETNIYYLLSISLIAALGGFLFGYDWVVIGGAKPFYETYFNIGDLPSLQGWVMGSAILGCLIGVAISGSLADRFGRKPLMLLAALIFIVASIGTGFSHTISVLIAYRIFGGVAIGIASTVSPMYISEISPAKARGKFVSINQLTIVLGILSAQIVNWLIAKPIIPSEDFLASWNVQHGWRWMFWVCAIPAFLYFIFVFFIPESPRWMTINKKSEKAFKTFNRLGGADYARKQVKEILSTPVKTEENTSLKSLFRGKMAKIILIGIIIAVLQQWSGINVIFNYAQEIFSSAGYHVSDMLFNIVITGVVNVIFTFVGIYTVDKLGRKTLMLFGTIGLTSIYAVLGLGYYLQVEGVLMLILVVSAIACYAMTLAPITWVVISELFPNRVRARAMAVSTFALWTACFVLTFTFPLLNKGLGSYGTFWLYGLICLGGFIFIKKYLPETKRKTLEEIEKEIVGE